MLHANSVKSNLILLHEVLMGDIIILSGKCEKQIHGIAIRLFTRLAGLYYETTTKALDRF